MGAPIQSRSVFDSLFNETESVLSSFEHTHLDPLPRSFKTSVEDDLHARDILSTKSAMMDLASSKVNPTIYTGPGLVLPPPDIYKRELLGDLFDITKSVDESRELSGSAETIASTLLDLAARDEYSSRLSERNNTLSMSLPEGYSGIKSNVETKLHYLLSSLEQHLNSSSPYGRDISERGILADLFNSTKSIVDNETGPRIASKLLGGAKAIAPNLIDLTRRNEYTSRFSRRGTTPSSSHENLSDVDDYSEKIHGLINSLKHHLYPSSPQTDTSEIRSLSSAFKAADDTLKPFGTSLTGIVNSASNGAASKAGSGLITEGESLFHHFFNRTAISNLIVTQGEPFPSRPDDPFSEYRRSVSSLFPAAASAAKKVGVDLDDIANSALKGAKTTATNGLLSKGESLVKGLFNRTTTM